MDKPNPWAVESNSRCVRQTKGGHDADAGLVCCHRSSVIAVVGDFKWAEPRCGLSRASRCSRNPEHLSSLVLSMPITMPIES